MPTLLQETAGPYNPAFRPVAPNPTRRIVLRALDTLSKEAFDELVQQSTSPRTTWLAIALAIVAFAYGSYLLAIVFADMV